MKNINNLFKNRRKELEITQSELAEYVGVSKSAVSRWESGDIQNMGIDKVKKLAKILKLNPIDIINEDYEEYYPVQNKDNIRNLFSDEKEILDPFNKLNEKGKKKVIDYANDLLNTDQYETVNVIGYAAAGNGYNYLDSVVTEKEVPYGERPKYDFVIQVTGDSMEPKIKDGSIAFVKLNTNYDNGKIYVIDYEGSAYIKKVYFENEKIIMKS